MSKQPYILMNGIAVPYPARGLTMVTSQTVNAGRNMNNTVVAQKVGRRQLKFDNFFWPHLTASQWRTISNIIENFEVTVTYFDTRLNKVHTRKFYFGDSSAEVWKVDLSNPTVAKPTEFINCKCNIIDMGVPE